ncbi:hypothetical protein FRC18_000232 [Serendipita sp. 400]|nr:hypothetical protein FRC18_000232 [Serendipita sp. 400]
MDIIGGAKTLVPEQWRPASVKNIWTDPVLSGREFITVVGTVSIFLILGLFLYYSFYIAIILSAAESLQPKQEDSQRPRIAGSYRGTIRHMISTVGLGHFLGGVVTFLWTTVLAWLGRWAITAPEGASLFIAFGGPQIISNILFEPLSIVFTHYILTTSQFSSLQTLQRLLLSKDFYRGLLYIGTIHGVTDALQATLRVPSPNQHYLRQLLIVSAFIILILARISLIIHVHASLLPPGTQTMVELPGASHYPPGQQLWHLLLRLFKLTKLLITCTAIGLAHFIMFMAALVFASGHGDKIAQLLAPSKYQVEHEQSTRLSYDPVVDSRHRY